MKQKNYRREIGNVKQDSGGGEFEEFLEISMDCLQIHDCLSDIRGATSVFPFVSSRKVTELLFLFLPRIAQRYQALLHLQCFLEFFCSSPKDLRSFLHESQIPTRSWSMKEGSLARRGKTLAYASSPIEGDRSVSLPAIISHGLSMPWDV